MGQYWKPVNLDKKEYLDPQKLGTGLKLWEQVANHPGTGAALVMLCAASPEQRGGGDLPPSDIVGRWAGDRIALIGDYTEDRDLAAEHKAGGIYDRCGNGDYRDITDEVCAEIEKALGGKFVGEGWREFVW